MRRFAVVSSCTSEKKVKVVNALTQKDFFDIKNLRMREKEIDVLYKAADMYTGIQHLRLMEGINLLRSSIGKEVIDLYILSAGYGLINEERIIAPYEVTFNSMNSKQILKWSNHLKIPQTLLKLISNYDLILFLLGEKYIRALQLNLLKIYGNQKLVFLGGMNSFHLIPKNGNTAFIKLGPKEASDFSYGLIGLKGYLFKLLANEVVRYEKKDIDLLELLYKKPSSFLTYLDKYRKYYKI